MSAKTDFGNNLFHMSKGKHCYTAGFAGRGKLSWDGGGRRKMKVGGRRIFFESVPSRTEADGGPVKLISPLYEPTNCSILPWILLSEEREKTSEVRVPSETDDQSLMTM